MKKLYIFIMAICFLITTASAATLEPVAINYTSNTITISGNVGTEYSGRFVSLFILNPLKDFSNITTDSSVLNWSDQSRVSNDGTFSFTFTPKADTGSYSYFVTVDGMSETLYCDEPYLYYSPDEIDVIWKKVDNAIKKDIPSDIQWVIDNRSELLQIDTTEFNSLSEQDQERVCEGIVRLTIDDIDQFKIEFNNTMRANKLYNADDEDTFKTLFNNEKKSFDKTILNIFDNILSQQKQDEILAKLATDDFYNIDEFKGFFDSYVLLEKLNSFVLWTEVDDFIDNEYKIFDDSTLKYSSLKNYADVAEKLLKNLPYNSMEEFKKDLYSFSKNADSDSSSDNRGSSPSGSKKTGGVSYSSDTTAIGDNTQNVIFKDIDNTYWAYDSISKMYKLGVITGYADGNFLPEANVTRAEFVKMLVSALNIKSEKYENSFVDVDENDWYYSPVVIGYNAGIIGGKEVNKFSPNDNITRQEMSTIIYRALLLKNKSFDVNELSFSDAKDIDSYAVDAITALNSKGIVTGYETGRFLPKNNASRAEATVIIQRTLNFVGLGGE